MCEIFGFSGLNPRQINKELKEFFSHSGKHPDGWGLALLDEDDHSVEKEPIPAYKSEYLKERLREPIQTKTLLAHIRLATIGSVTRPNTHPFVERDCTGRRWTLIHNGTIFDFPKLGKYGILQRGFTDSERILLYILDEVKHETELKGEPLDVEERFDLLERITYDMSEGNKLNLLIYDGEWMYAHYNAENTLYYYKDSDGCMIATTPINDHDWRPFLPTRLTAFKDGKMVLEGTNHGHIFTENKSAMNQFYMTYSEL